MSPLLGRGTRMALLDVSMLAQALDSHAELLPALLAFDQRAWAMVAEFQRINRWLTRIFQSENRMLVVTRHLVQIAHRRPFVSAGTCELLIGR